MVLVSSDWSTRDSDSIDLIRLPTAPRRPVTLLAACSARSWAAWGFVSRSCGRSARVISTVVGSPVSGSVVSTMIEPRFAAANPERMLEPWKVVEPAMWLMEVMMELALVVLASCSCWVVVAVLAEEMVSSLSSMRRSERTERPPSWAPSCVDSLWKLVRRRSMESLEAWSLVETTRPVGSSAARLICLPVESRWRDWAMSARCWLRRGMPKVRFERP